MSSRRETASPPEEIRRAARPAGWTERLDDAISLRALLLGFWCVFWLLNGLDKFFDDPYFFGVTRDAKFVDYFARLRLPADAALASLYSCAVWELVLAGAFGAALLRGDRVLERLALKGSVLLFAVFSAADVLFGDRAELWEHGTFLILVLASAMALQASGPPHATQTNSAPISRQRSLLRR